MTAKGKITASQIARDLDAGQPTHVLITDHEFCKETTAAAGPDSVWFPAGRKTLVTTAVVRSYETVRRPGDMQQRYQFVTDCGTVAPVPGAQTFWLAPAVEAATEPAPDVQPTTLDGFDPALVRIDRARRSVTQGNVTLFYDGEQLGESGYHDEIVSCTDSGHDNHDAQTHNGAQCWGGAGNVAGYHGYDDRFWLNVASSLHAKRAGIDFTETAGQPFNPGTGVQEGFVAGVCGHRVAVSEWKAGFRHCERWPGCTPDVTTVDVVKLTPEATAAVDMLDKLAATLATVDAEARAQVYQLMCDVGDDQVPAADVNAKLLALDLLTDSAKAIVAKTVELQTATAAMMANFDRPMYGSSRTKQFGRRVDAQLRRGGEHGRNVKRIEGELAALVRQATQPTSEPVPLDLGRLSTATHIRTRHGWHEVVKVNKATVKVKVDPGWDDLIPIAKILETREISPDVVRVRRVDMFANKFVADTLTCDQPRWVEPTDANLETAFAGCAKPPAADLYDDIRARFSTLVVELTDAGHIAADMFPAAADPVEVSGEDEWQGLADELGVRA